jgi:hypothetical protein
MMLDRYTGRCKHLTIERLRSQLLSATLASVTTEVLPWVNAIAN